MPDAPSPVAPDSHVDPAERVPLGTKLAAGSGEAAINIGINLPKSFAFPIYNLVLGVNPTLLGIALLVPRLWDAVLDPLMGNLTDRTRSRFGRRRPYMLVGAILAAVCIGLLCIFPRGFGEAEWAGDLVNFSLFGWDLSAEKKDYAYAAWLLVSSLLFYTALTIFSVPYGALTMELTRDYEERTRVMSFRTLFTYLSGFALAWVYAIAESDWFVGEDGEPDAILGAYAVGVGLVILMGVVMLVPTLFVRERSLAEVPDAARARPKIGFWRALVTTLRSRAFLMIVAVYTIGFLGVILVVGFGLYVAIYHVYGGDRDTGSVVQGWAQTLAACAGITATFIINRLATRVEKKLLLFGALMCSFVGGLLSWVLYSPDLPTYNLIGWVPGTDADWPVHPLSFSYALIWPGLAGLLIMSNSMIADLCDVDELETGERREGMYWAVFSWIQKTAISVALLFSGILLDVAGFNSTKDAVQTPEAVWNMRVIFVLGVCGGVGLAAVLTLFIPLSKARMTAVRAELEAREGPDLQES